MAECAADVERIDALRSRLADTGLYSDGAGAQRAASLRQVLDARQAELVGALQAWHDAAEAAAALDIRM